MSFDDSIHSLVDPDDENGWNTQNGIDLTDAQVDAIFDDVELDRAEDLGNPTTEAFYPDWNGPVLIDPDFLPDFDPDDLPF